MFFFIFFKKYNIEILKSLHFYWPTSTFLVNSCFSSSPIDKCQKEILSCSPPSSHVCNFFWHVQIIYIHRVKQYKLKHVTHQIESKPPKAPMGQYVLSKSSAHMKPLNFQGNTYKLYIILPCLRILYILPPVIHFMCSIIIKM